MPRPHVLQFVWTVMAAFGMLLLNPSVDADPDADQRLTEIRIEIQKMAVRIQGTAITKADIADCMVRLEQSNLFDNVVLRHLRIVANRKTFEIRCKRRSAPPETGPQLTESQFLETVHQIVTATE